MTVTNNNEKNALAQEQAKHLMMSEILERYYHTGKHNKVCCPFHEEKTPSFTYKKKSSDRETTVSSVRDVADFAELFANDRISGAEKEKD